MTEGTRVFVAFVLGVLGSLPFFFLAQVLAFGLVSVAGVVTAWVVSDRARGLIGLLLGIAAPFTVYGGYEVVRKLDACATSSCSGLSSPGLTLAIVVGFGLIGLASGGAGYALARLVRVVALRLGASSRISR